MNVYKTAQILNETIQRLQQVKVEGKTNWKLMIESVEELETILRDMITLINQQAAPEENLNDYTSV